MQSTIHQAEAGVLTFNHVTAVNLAQRDRRSDSDPYVRWTCEGSETATHWLQNVLGRQGGRTHGSDRPCEWDGEYSMSVPPSAVASADDTVEVDVSLWDSDRTSDDFLGSATLKIATRGEAASKPQLVRLELRNERGFTQIGGGAVSAVSFEASYEPPLRRPPPTPPPTPPTPAAPPVTRKEIRSMSAAEQQRYVAAVSKMMENADLRPVRGGGARAIPLIAVDCRGSLWIAVDRHSPLTARLPPTQESSAFFALAGIHGWPGKGTERNYSYCEHRQETFPGWHRAYLCAFESALQVADRALGNDGRLGLPYWDVLGQPELKGEVFPAILRTHFPNGVETVRKLLRDPASVPVAEADSEQNVQRDALWQSGYGILEDATLRQAVERERLAQRAREVLWVAQHYRAASTFGSQVNAADCR